MENPLHHYDIDQADLNADCLQAPVGDIVKDVSKADGP
jgi:hypothetical protein